VEEEPPAPPAPSPAERDVERHRARRSARKGRVRRLLRRLPHRTNIGRYPVVRWFAEAARRRPYLWSFQTGEVRRALYVGAVIAFLPLYGLQLFLAFWAAVLLRANLPVTCGLQLATNPVTVGPAYLLAYRVGIAIIEGLEVGEGLTPMGTRINALFLGGTLLGLGCALLLDLAYRFAVWEAGRLRERHRRAEARLRAEGNAPVESDAAEAGDRPADGNREPSASDREPPAGSSR
jgi:uncharacterized protein